MSAEPSNGLPDQPGYTRCQICDREMRRPRIILYGIVFCDEHRRELRIRRRTGVGAADLSAVWRDKLDTWHERPSELDAETGRRRGATRLFFASRYGDWVVFRRGFPQWIGWRQFFRQFASGLSFGRIKHDSSTTVLYGPLRGRRRSRLRAPRLADFLAVNVVSGAIRRFVDVTDAEVHADLSSIRPAPDQAELASHWGDPRPTGMREKRQDRFREQVAPGHQLLIAALVGQAQFPVYGLVVSPFDLRLSGAGWSGSGGEEISGISLRFAAPPENGVERRFDLDTSAVDQPGVSLPPETDDEQARHLDERLFWNYWLTPEQRRQARPPGEISEPHARAGDPELQQGEVQLGTHTYGAQLRFWTVPYLLARFRLSGSGVRVSGTSFGLDKAQVWQLINQLEMISQRAETLVEYQQQLDWTWAQLRQQRGAYRANA